MRKLSVCVLVFSLLLSPLMPQCVSAQDFVASSWAMISVLQAEEMGLIPPVLQSADLRQAINRGEYAALAVRLFEFLTGEEAGLPANNPFSDTADPEVLKAYQNNLMVGVSATEFQPHVLLNRETAATALANLARRCLIPDWQKGANYKVDFTMPPLFSDDEYISDWARESVYFMASLGIIRGMENNIIAPRNVTADQVSINFAGASREQAIIMIGRMAEDLQGTILKAEIVPLSTDDEDTHFCGNPYDQDITLYVPNEGRDGFDTITGKTCGCAEHIVSLLVDAEVYPDSGVALDYFNFNGRYGYADMNPAFGTVVTTTGTTGEYLYFGCLVNTLLTFFDLDEIDLTVDGEIIETGHETYDYPFTFYGNQQPEYGYVDADGRVWMHPVARTQGIDMNEVMGSLGISWGIDLFAYILRGYWIDYSGRFIQFGTMDFRDIDDITYGLFDSEFSQNGQLTATEFLGDATVDLTFAFQERPGSAMSDGTPAFVGIIRLSCMSLQQDGTILIKFMYNEPNEWLTYSFGGMTLEDAYAESHSR
ncbi:MAG: hypothetical protein FWE76_02910 [Symbiobacteriaceae bacterium]|nr:hypothetical protein [Symbiobacteriaceae bacterium]